jgi:hypothetical protein
MDMAAIEPKYSGMDYKAGEKGISSVDGGGLLFIFQS